MRAFKILFLLIIFLSLPLQAMDYEYLIRVSISERKLYLIDTDAQAVAVYPVAIPNFIPNDLPFEGDVVKTEKNPRWYPTERGRLLYMQQHNEELPKIVEPGNPRNMMGAASIEIKFTTLGVNPLIRIHGTNDENSIGKKVTSGCIRLHNKDILALVDTIEGKKTKVIFEK
jgi:lipoprotein-anchoring transpeptidase ErfK/SrfK